MIKAFAAFMMIFGLLKFANDAPELFKKLFGSGGLFDGISLNPNQQIRNDIQGIRSGYNKLTSPVWTATRTAVGGVAGLSAGFKAGGADKTGWNKVKGSVVGGARGLVAGGRTGYNGSGFEPNVRQAEFAARNTVAISDSNRQNFSQSAKNYQTVYDAMMAGSKDKIGKAKEKKKELERDNNLRKQEYINSYLNNTENIDRIIAEDRESQVSAAVDQRVRDMFVMYGMDPNTTITDQHRAAIRNNASEMQQINSAVNEMDKNAALEIAKNRAKSEANSLYDAEFEAAKREQDDIINNAMKQSIFDNKEVANQLFEKVNNDMRSWGPEVKRMFDQQLNASIYSNNSDFIKELKKFNDVDAAEINQLLGRNVAGANQLNNLTLSQSDIEKIINSDCNLAKANIMKIYQDALKKTNTNMSVYSSAINAMAAANANSNSNGGSGNGGGHGHGGH